MSVDGWDDDIVMRSLEREQLEALLEGDDDEVNRSGFEDLQSSLMELVTPAQRAAIRASVSNLNHGYAEILAQAKQWAESGKRKRSPGVIFEHSGVKPKRHKKNQKQRRKSRLDREARLERRKLVQAEIQRPFLEDNKDGRVIVDVSSSESDSKKRVDTVEYYADDAVAEVKIPEEEVMTDESL